MECVTAQVGAGANIVLFTTGLGTPTGNPITPVVKLSTNATLVSRMEDVIDVDTSAVISGQSDDRAGRRRHSGLRDQSRERRCPHQSRAKGTSRLHPVEARRFALNPQLPITR